MDPVIQSMKAGIDRSWESGEIEADALIDTMEYLDQGYIRVAEKKDGEWVVNEWIKHGILLYFRFAALEEGRWGDYIYNDKIPLKSRVELQNIRIVPPGTVRYGAFLEPGCVVMPGYVNLGAYVGAGTMVDTWATVGSCAQIGKNVHLSGGVGIGGVLEPVGARPVIIEDNCFIGSRCVIVEGALIEEGAVIAAGTTITASTPIIDVTGAEPVTYKGRVPPNSVVIPGTRPKEFPAGTYQIPCALIIGQRSESTDRKTSLNAVLREHGLAV